jgi:hypothetical protein
MSLRSLWRRRLDSTAESSRDFCLTPCASGETGRRKKARAERISRFSRRKSPGAVAKKTTTTTTTIIFDFTLGAGIQGYIRRHGTVELTESSFLSHARVFSEARASRERTVVGAIARTIDVVSG